MSENQLYDSDYQLDTSYIFDNLDKFDYVNIFD